jgi:hypothetical protein
MSHLHLLGKKFRKLPYKLESIIISPRYNKIKFYELHEEELLPPNLAYIKVYQEPSIFYQNN